MWRVSQNVSRQFCPIQAGWENPARVLLIECRSYSNQPPTAGKPQPKTSPPQQKTPPPPPPPPRSGGILWKVLGLMVAGSGGVVGYAWYDNDFRTKLEGIHPQVKQQFDRILPVAEKPTPVIKKNLPSSLAIDPDEAKSRSLQKKKDPVPIPAIETKSASPESEIVKPTKAEIEAKKKEDERHRKEEEKKQEEERKLKLKQEAERKIQEQEMEEAAENLALENTLEMGLEDLERSVKSVIDLQHAAASATRDHTQKLRQAMELQGDDKENQWESATVAFAAKSDTLAEAQTATETTRMEMERLQSAISEGKANKVTKKNKVIRSTEQTVNSLNYDLKTAIAGNSRAQSEARVMAEYRDLVKKGQEQFRKEVESLTPDVSLTKKGGKLSEEELNALIAHAHRRIEQLQRQLAEQGALEELRIRAALDKQREEDEIIADGRIEQEKELLKGQFSLVRDKWEVDSRVNFERELRQQLSRQAAAHSDHLADVLKVQETQLNAKYQIRLDEQIASERLKFQTEVAGWIARLKGIEAAVEGRAELEQQGRKAQELWLACQMLHNVIQSGPKVPDDIDPLDSRYEEHMMPLMDEFVAVLDAGSDHPFVNSVLSTIPDNAAKRGVWTEKQLTERFQKVRKVCWRVAMVDEAGGTLYNYFLSYIQCLFVFRSTKPFAETDKIDVSKLTTFSILDNAQHHLEHGNLETALRFMNQLQGEPRNVAADWIKEARLLLETQLAAESLVAHASSQGLGSLF